MLYTFGGFLPIYVFKITQIFLHLTYFRGGSKILLLPQLNTISGGNYTPLYCRFYNDVFFYFPSVFLAVELLLRSENEKVKMFRKFVLFFIIISSVHPSQSLRKIKTFSETGPSRNVILYRNIRCTIAITTFFFFNLYTWRFDVTVTETARVLQHKFKHNKNHINVVGGH